MEEKVGVRPGSDKSGRHGPLLGVDAFVHNARIQKQVAAKERRWLVSLGTAHHYPCDMCSFILCPNPPPYFTDSHVVYISNSLPSPSPQAATIIMVMPLRQLLLVLLLVVASLGLVHAEDFPEGSVVRAAEPTEHDKNNPLFKVSTVVGWAQERVGREKNTSVAPVLQESRQRSRQL
jgi:hypothetical protein